MRERLKRLWANMDSAKASIWGVIIGFVVLGNAAAYGFIRQDDTNAHFKDIVAQQEADRIATAKLACESGDELRDIIREKLVEAPLEIGEAIIEASTRAPNRPPPDPAVIEAFRQIEHDRLARIASELPGRRWDEQTSTCVDVVLNGENDG